VAQPSPAVCARLHAENVEVVVISSPPGSEPDAQEVISVVGAGLGSWVVVDGYHFGPEYQQVLKNAGLRILLVDDSGDASSYPAQIILNQNAHASRSLYRTRDAGSRLLLGPRYAMLRREFKPWRDFKRDIVECARQVLVTMGGSDPANLTPHVIEALKQLRISGLEARIVVGGDNAHFEELEEAGHGFTIVRNVSNMPFLMAWADIAVSAAGSTCLEMCFLGLPAILIDVAPNQTAVAKELARLGAAVHVGNAASVTSRDIASSLPELLNSQKTRVAMARRQKSLVDGRGAERILAAIQNANLRLRKVEEGDCRLLWEWANDPAVRRVSFSTESIPWEQHVQWFNSKLADINLRHYVVLDDRGVPVGQARYELDGPSAVMSINLAPGLRGRGTGSAMLALATDEVFRDTNAKVIQAYVKPDNEASVRLFVNAGFTRQATVSMRGQQAIHFVLERSSGW
jgi:spore coat polysaccharide biosynthesis predicted glycosyltransferase SpsG/L-amino acid N-acyltransferase YncA